MPATQMEKIKTMRRDRVIYFLLGLFGFLATTLEAQTPIDTLSGEVSYITSQSIYVRFASTKGIAVGDTLFGFRNNAIRPLLAVKHLSSTSCVGTPLDSIPIEKGTQIIALTKRQHEPAIIEAPPIVTSPENENPIEPEEEMHPDDVDEPIKKIKKTENVTGRISAATYLFFSDDARYNKQRMRYTLNMNVKQLGSPKLSMETYISFRHTINEWQEVKDNFGRTFKVYNLALKYMPNEKTNIWIGRKINYNLSNVGAIDGVQVEKNWKKFLTGVFAGSRPDHLDYGFNSQLLQFGAYAGNKWEFKKGTIQNTLAFAEQRNGGMTDRRFGYIQHMNSAINRVNIFTSFEFDLYTIENDKPKNTFNVSGLYASIRYRPFDKLSLFASYDARKNIIYYETYKNLIDQLLEDETRQGFRVNFNYRPLKKITIGASAGYRFQKQNPAASKNANGYVTLSRIPGINASATASAVWIQSAFLDGLIYGVRFSKDLINGKLFAEAEYRIANYTYTSSETQLKQSIFSTNLSWRLARKTSFMVNYEGELQEQKISSRIYINVIQRF